MRAETIRVVLDTPAMIRLFNRIPILQTRNVDGGGLAALWVKPGRHFNACYRLRLSDASGEVLASAYVLEPTRAAQIKANLVLHAANGNGDACGHCGTLLAQPDLLLQLFPFDYRLPTLAACVDADGIAQALNDEVRFTAYEPIGYRPGMRCQIRYRTAAGTNVYGKTAVEQIPGQTFALHERVYGALRGSRRLAVPQPLRYLAELRLALIADAPGESLHALLKSDRALSAEVHAIAAALADFHRLGVDGIERVHTLEDEVNLLGGWVRFITELFPSMAPTLNESYEELVHTLPKVGGTKALVHRDFYDKQVLLSSHRVTFLDMDTACHGDAEIDLGNFCAQLQLRGLQFGRQLQCAQLERTFLAAYPAIVAPDVVAWYRRSSLLRLACGYALRPKWHHLTPTLLEQFRR